MNQFVNSAIIGALIFLALLSWFKKNNTPLGYRFLSLMFILIAISFVGDLLQNSSILFQNPELNIIFEPILFVVSPLIYLAVAYLTSENKIISTRLLLHFIPYMLLLCLYSIDIIFSHEVSSTSKTASDIDKILELSIIGIYFIQLTLYLYFSLACLKKHKNRLPFFLSNISGNDLHWLYNSLKSFCVLFVVVLVETLFDQIDVTSYLTTFYLIGFYYIGIQIAGQKNVPPLPPSLTTGSFHITDTHQGVSDKIEIKECEHDVNRFAIYSNAEIVARKQIINDEQLNEYKIKLLEVMDSEKPYLDSELTLAKLGKLIGLDLYKTSYIINACMGGNFYVFINQYRLEACKNMLIARNYNHLSILEIAFEAGFNSKTTFNTSFKKSTGLSPKAYRNQFSEKIISSNSSVA